MTNKKPNGRKRVKNPLNSVMAEKYIGFEIIGSDCKKIGLVVSVVNYGASDIIIANSLDIISLDSKKQSKEFMIPMTPNAILNINEQQKTITINEEFAA
ncbi:MAG: hypothetical protein LBU68_01540 [Rickettsiales bacterium]|nr:hypothetical protein [Rickettsiales bacterium]